MSTSNALPLLTASSALSIAAWTSSAPWQPSRWSDMAALKIIRSKAGPRAPLRASMPSSRFFSACEHEHQMNES